MQRQLTKIPGIYRSISDNGINVLIECEALIQVPYKDSAGKLTIGVGHLLTQSELVSGKLSLNGTMVYWKNGLSREQCIDLLKQDLLSVTNNINSVINPTIKNSLSQNKIDALIIFAFNIGNSGFNNSTLLKKLNVGNLSEIPSELMKWTKETKTNKYGIKTKVESKGLINRRTKEVKLWNGL